MELSYKIIKKNNLNVSEDLVRIDSYETVFKKEIRDFDSGDDSLEKQTDFDTPEEKPEPPSKEELMRDFLEEIKIRREKTLQEISAEANEKAEAIKEKAIEEGYAEGHARGYRKGIEESAKEGETIKRKAIEVFKQCEEEVENYLELQKHKIIKLAGDMAKLIVNHEIETNNDRLLDMLKPIIQDYKRAGTVVISCSDSHQKPLKKNINLLKEINPDLEFIILRDQNFEENDVTLEYQNQIIDLNISKQIESMVRELQSLEV